MKKNYFYNLLLTVFNLVIPVISFPFVARVLGPEGIGKAQFIFSLAMYLSVLAALGIPSYGVREIARVRHNNALLGRTFRELLLVNIISCAATAVLLTIVVLFHPFFDKDLRLYTAAIIVVLCSFGSIEWLFSGLERFRAMAFRSIIIKCASLAALLLLVRLPGDVYPYLWISCGAILANNVANLVAAAGIYKAGRELPLQVKRHIKPVLLLFGTTIASTLYTTFDSVLLGMLSNERSVGLYAAATRITKISIPVIIAYGGVLVPGISRSITAGDDVALGASLNRSYAYILLLAVPITSGLFVFAPGIISLFSGQQFTDAIVTMRIMAVLPLLIGLGYFWGYQVILPMGRDRLLLVASFMGMALSLLLNFLLVPRWKQDGAAIANIAAETIVTLAYFLLIRRHQRVTIRRTFLWEAVAACLPIWMFLFLKPDFIRGNMTLTFLLCGAAGTAGYLAIQTLLFRNPLITELLYSYRLLKR